MQVSKWGNSLAVRIPAMIVEVLDLKEGDQIEMKVTGAKEIEVARDPTRELALESLRKMRLPLPPGWKFDREEAHQRSRFTPESEDIHERSR